MISDKHCCLPVLWCYVWDDDMHGLPGFASMPTFTKSSISVSVWEVVDTGLKQSRHTYKPQQ